MSEASQKIAHVISLVSKIVKRQTKKGRRVVYTINKRYHFV